MTKHLTTRILTLLLALLVSAPAAAQRIADLTPRSSIAEDDNFYCVADDASYQGVCDLQLIRSEIQERIHGANLQTGTTYELVLADAGKVVELTNASPITLTIPANASVAFPVNTVIQVVQGGAGAVTINITSDTLNGSTSIGSQWDSLLLWKRAATEWVGIMPANTDSDAIHDNVAGEISAITEKATLVDADLLLIEDSAASNAKKKAQVGNLPWVKKGTSFPGSPATNDRFFRTDLQLEFFYDGTRWLSLQRIVIPIAYTEHIAFPYTVTITPTHRWAVGDEFELWLEDWVSTSQVLTTNDGSNFWTTELRKIDHDTGSSALIVSFSTAADPADAVVTKRIAIDAVLDVAGNVESGFVTIIKTGSAGNWRFVPGFIVARYIAN